jgi:hypothetical protein
LIRTLAILLTLVCIGCATATKKAEGEGPRPTPKSMDAIRGAIRFRLREFRACFEENFGTKPDANGKVVLVWILGKSGEISETSIASDNRTLPPSKLFDECMIGVLKEIPFAPVEFDSQPADGEELEAEIHYPFQFEFSRVVVPKPGVQLAPQPSATPSPSPTSAH